MVKCSIYICKFQTTEQICATMGLCTGFEDTVQHKAVSHVCYLTKYNYSSVIGSVLNRTIVNGSILDRTIVIGSKLDRTIVIGSILDDDLFDFILDNHWFNIR